MAAGPDLPTPSLLDLEDVPSEYFWSSSESSEESLDLTDVAGPSGSLPEETQSCHSSRYILCIKVCLQH